jgi:hypothetical protein
MKIKRARYQKSSIRRVSWAIGSAWEVRFSEYRNGKRHQKCLTFDPSEFPAEPRWSADPIRDVSLLAVSSWIRDLRSPSDPAKFLSPTVKTSIRSIMRQCFELAALHGYLPPTERSPMSLVKIQGTGTRFKEIRPLTPDEFQKLLANHKWPLFPSLAHQNSMRA